MSDTEDIPPRLDPTKGLRVRVENFTVGHGQTDNMLGMVSETGYTSDEQAAANAAHINRLLAVDEIRNAERQQSTQPVSKEMMAGLRLDVWDEELSFTTEAHSVKMTPLWLAQDQMEVYVTYINWLIETDEKRREHMAKQHAGAQDILVDMGDMTRVDLDSIQLDLAYESMTEDMIQTVNHIILQGIEPIKALFSMSQAFAIVMGYALRANMPFEVARALITQVMKSATASEQMVRIITKQ